MWDFNLTFLKSLFQNWHVSTEHLTFSISIPLTENIFAGKKKKRILASFIQNVPRSSRRAAHLKEECTAWEAFLFVFFSLLIIWFHRKVVGIDNYAICNPVVFPVREIPDTPEMPGLVTTSQPLCGWWIICRVLVIRTSASRGRQTALAGAVLTPQWNCRLFITCQQPGWFETLTFSSSAQRLVRLSLLRSLQTFDTAKTQEDV